MGSGEAVKGVLFDAGGVLYTRTESPSHLLARFAAESGHDHPSEETRARLRKLRADATVGRIAPATLWDASLRLYGIDAADERKILVAHLEAQADDVLPVAGARDAILDLKRRGLRIGVVTDTVHPQERKLAWLRRAGVADLLDTLVCSTALGIAKPDSRIYLAALERLATAPERTAFVGREPSGLADARALGMTTVGVDHPPEAVADHLLRRIEELPGLPIFG